MPTESKGLTRERTRKEKALATLREHQVAQFEGRLLDAAAVEAAWSRTVARFRAAVLQLPPRIAPRFPDPQRAEVILREECELVLRTLSRDGS